MGNTDVKLARLRKLYRLTCSAAKCARFMIGGMIMIFILGAPVVLMLAPLPIQYDDISQALRVWLIYAVMLVILECVRRVLVHAAYVTHLKIEEYETED